jgi:hypothetical protein
MKAVWQGRMARTAATYGEHAPMAAVCCNACRTCVQTNALGIVLGAALGAGATAMGVARRIVGRSPAAGA